MIFKLFIFPLLLSLLSAGLLVAQDVESNQGALILISKEGTIRHLDKVGIPQEDIKIEVLYSQLPGRNRRGW